MGLIRSLTADVNGDGKLDLISANWGDNTLSVLTNATVFPGITAPSGLVGWWRAEGNANDSVGANNGVLGSGAGFTNGEVGQAFAFNGTSSSHVSIPDSPVLDSFTNRITIELWFKANETSANSDWEALVSKGNATWEIQATTGAKTLSFYMTGPSPNGVTGTRNVKDGQWHHVAAAYDGTNICLYVDGTLDVSTPSSGTITQNSYPMGIGYNTQGVFGSPAYFFVGLVDEVSLYHRALSSNEIAAIYNAGSAGKYIASSVPIITSQPQSQTNFVGATVTFQVGATNSIPLGYQWRKNTTNLVDGGNLVGTHTNTLTLMNIAYNDAAIYSVIVSNANGSVTSSNAILTVLSPRAATGIALLTGSFVTGVSITDGGGGYTNTPLVRFIGGGGSGAGAYAVVSNGIVISITITNAGYGYTNAPLVVVDPPFILNPVLNIARISFLAFSNLTVGSSYQLQQSWLWYWTNQPVSFTATNTVYMRMVGGAAGGGNYRLAVAPVPAQAFATPQVVYGFVVGATLTSGGSGYVASPAVSIIGGGGAGAAAVAQVSAGAVTNIMFTSAGAGYTNLPAVEIAPPPVIAVSPTILTGMRLDLSNLVPYDNYQLQFAPDIMAGWINWSGGLFSPTAVTNSQFLVITNNAGFFRVQSVP